MNDINELIETVNRLCENIDKMANNEKKFCVDMQIALEQTSWEITRHANSLKELAYYFGG
jgi:hypothetical protein